MESIWWFVLCFEHLANFVPLSSAAQVLPYPPAKKVAFIPPTKHIPLELKFLMVILHDASHAGGVYPIRDMLVDLVNANQTLLPAYKVGVKTYDTKYNMEYNVGETVSLFMKNIANEAYDSATTTESDVCRGIDDILAPRPNNSCTFQLQQGRRAFPLFYGPAYSAECKVLAHIAPKYNLVHISDYASAPQLSDKTKYPTFFRTQLNSNDLSTLPRYLCNYLNITTVYLASLDELYASEPMDAVGVDLRTHSSNITVLSESKFRTRNNDTIDLMLDSFRHYDARIIIFWSDEYDEYRIFCRSIDRWQKYNERFSSAKYLGIFMSVGTGPEVLKPTELSDVPGCSRSALESMLNGSLVALTPTWGPPAERLDWGMSTADFIAKAEELGRTKYGHKTGEIAARVSLTIDALWLGFLTLDAVDRRLRAETPQPRTLLDFTFESNDIMEMVKEELVKTRFRGASGDVAFDAKSDIVGNIIVQQYRPGRSASLGGEFVDVLKFDTASQVLIELTPSKPLVFGTSDGLVPSDKASPPAPDGKLLVTVLLVVITGTFLLAFVAAIAGFVVFKRKILAASLANPAWLVDSRLLVMRESHSMVSRSSLAFGRSMSLSGSSLNGNSNMTALLNEQVVRLQVVPVTGLSIVRNLQTHKFLSSFHANLQHPNIVRWIGYSSTYVESVTTEAKRNQYLLWEYCEKGSLEQLTQNNAFTLDAAFECAIMLDVAQGMAFLHKSSIVNYAHGALCAEACVIDKRFSVKVADYGDALLANLFGLKTLHDDGHATTNDGQQIHSLSSQRMLYWAPELLRNTTTATTIGSARLLSSVAAGQTTNFITQLAQAADIYAYAITMHVLLTCAPPFDSHSLPADKILEFVSDSSRSPPFRPEQQTSNTGTFTSGGRNTNDVLSLLQSAWSEDPVNRPPFRQIVRKLQTISGVKASTNVTDQLLNRLEHYASDMEQLVAERTLALEAEHKRADELLNSMLPAEIATELKRHGAVYPESFENVTIYFSDIVGFTALSASSTPIEVVNLLNALYTVFDMQIDSFDAYKIETIGDAYMVVSGLPRRNGIQHAAEIAKLSLSLLSLIQVFAIPHRANEKLRLRIGIHTGPCVAGVVGVKMPRYCLFGDTVNTASRMESTGEALRIHVSEAAKVVLDFVGGFKLEERGQLEVKGKGMMITFWLISALPP